jgi:hypothetical protein
MNGILNRFAKTSLLFLIAAIMLSGAARADNDQRSQGIQPISYDEFAKTGVEPKVSKVYLDPTRGWVPLQYIC